MDELSWLNFPPEDLQIDIVVGHGVKLVIKHKLYETLTVKCK